MSFFPPQQQQTPQPLFQTQQTSLFQPQQTNSIFSQSQPQQTNSIFSQSQPQQTNSIFSQPQQQQQTSLFQPQQFQQQQQQLNQQQQQQVQQQLYLFTNDKAPANYSTKWADLHPDSQKLLLQIEYAFTKTPKFVSFFSIGFALVLTVILLNCSCSDFEILKNQ
jgi:nucleoporin p58/p45